MSNLIKNLTAGSMAIIIFFGCCLNFPAQDENGAALDFDPRTDGFSFKNYRNEGDKWKDDLATDDLIRMFGFKTSCKSGENEKNCVLHPAAKQWMEEMLEGMKIGHCEGIAVACLRMNTDLPFKKRVLASHFQTGAKSPFTLQRSQLLENYIAYYWITQTFDEVKKQTAQTAESGPVNIAKTLLSAMKNQSDTYLISFFKYDKKTNVKSDGHAVAPFRVEETADKYLIYVYDNNFPGETRIISVKKTAAQEWEYNSKPDPKGKADYLGDISTATLRITATSWRDGRCFKSNWRKEKENAGCAVAESLRPRPIFTNAAFQPAFFTPDEDDFETAEFFLTDEGDMLITDPDGDRIGYDPKTDYFYEEIPKSLDDALIGGFFEDVPHYTLPFIDSEEAEYQVVFSGKHLTDESDLDFVYSAPGFTIGFSDILLDPRETLEATISTNGEQIRFKASADAETPEVFFAVEPDKDDDASYFAFVEGVELAAGKTLTYDFDFENGKLFFSDDDGNEDSYDITLIRVNADGTIQTFEKDNLDIGKTDRYEMDFKNWDGKTPLCIKDDDDNDGSFDDETDENCGTPDEDDDEN
jgi:hypothetical protein